MSSSPFIVHLSSNQAVVTFVNPNQLSTPTGFSYSGLSENSVTLSWNAVSNAQKYVLRKGSTVIYQGSGISFTDGSIEPGGVYVYSVIATATGYYDSASASQTVTNLPRVPTPTLLLASQGDAYAKLSIVSNFSESTQLVLSKNGVVIASHAGSAQGDPWTYTDNQLLPNTTYLYEVYQQPSQNYYRSLTVSLQVRLTDFSSVMRQQDYLRSLKRPFTKLCRLRFLNPNTTTAFALDNSRKNKRSRAFISNGSVSANLQNGQRISATVTLENTVQQVPGWRVGMLRPDGLRIISSGVSDASHVLNPVQFPDIAVRHA